MSPTDGDRLLAPRSPRPSNVSSSRALDEETRRGQSRVAQRGATRSLPLGRCRAMVLCVVFGCHTSTVHAPRESARAPVLMLLCCCALLCSGIWHLVRCPTLAAHASAEPANATLGSESLAIGGQPQALVPGTRNSGLLHASLACQSTFRARSRTARRTTLRASHRCDTDTRGPVMRQGWKADSGTGAHWPCTPSVH